MLFGTPVDVATGMETDLGAKVFADFSLRKKSGITLSPSFVDLERRFFPLFEDIVVSSVRYCRSTMI